MRAERAVAVLWATHLCDEVPEADRVIVLHRGKVLADTTPAKLVAGAGTATIEEAFLAMTGRGARRRRVGKGAIQELYSRGAEYRSAVATRCEASD